MHIVRAALITIVLHTAILTLYQPCRQQHWLAESGREVLQSVHVYSESKLLRRHSNSSKGNILYYTSPIVALYSTVLYCAIQPVNSAIV
jgi:hypothetical protein